MKCSTKWIFGILQRVTIKRSPLGKETRWQRGSQIPKSNKSELPKNLYGTNLKKEIVDILVPLHQLKGKEDVLNFVEHYYYLMQVVCAESEYVDEAQIMSDQLASWLQTTKVFW